MDYNDVLLVAGLRHRIVIVLRLKCIFKKKKIHYNIIQKCQKYTLANSVIGNSNILSYGKN